MFLVGSVVGFPFRPQVVHFEQGISPKVRLLRPKHKNSERCTKRNGGNETYESYCPSLYFLFRLCFPCQSASIWCFLCANSRRFWVQGKGPAPAPGSSDGGAGGLRRDVVTWGAKGAALESAGQWRRAFEAEGGRGFHRLPSASIGFGLTLRNGDEKFSPGPQVPFLTRVSLGSFG